ncbi:hypothetical protein BpHYR1_036037 [Brachionus plicatilis]|uniref:Uncharacterized protein n=1 Tax=Brachionus plicatilis TaxID=10195 RepID=A0A3M7PMM0_BRAPC|nr:hypothetical protein BpHYR1_036037 [Brachionus plicatilis]
MPKSITFAFEMLYYSYQEIDDFLLHQHPMIYPKSNLYNFAHHGLTREVKEIFRCFDQEIFIGCES